MSATFSVNPTCTSLGWRANVNGKVFTATKVSTLRQSISTYLLNFLQNETEIPLSIDTFYEPEDFSWKFTITTES